MNNIISNKKVDLWGTNSIEQSYIPINNQSVVKSISYDNDEIVDSILRIHVPNHRIDCDPTYSKGVFYKSGLIAQPTYKFDINPQTPDTVQADCRQLPLSDNSIGCLMFDPPFVVGSGPSTSKNKKGTNIIGKRFSSFQTPTDVMEFYKQSIDEFYRVLIDGGVLIFKCQDLVACGSNYFSHVYIHNVALKCGFYPKDLFILLAKNRIIGRYKTQEHARKYHSYFWVFVKNDDKINKVSLCNGNEIKQD